MSSGERLIQLEKQIYFKNKLRIFGGIIGIIIGFFIFRLDPPMGLTPQAMQCLGIFAWAVVYWMFNVIPDYVTSILMCTFWVTFKVAPFNTAFASFSGDTIWLLISALGIGAAVAKSGLLKRGSLFIIKYFPGNFKGQTFGLLMLGTIVSPLIPSATAKVTIVAPFAKGISDKLGYEKQSKGAGGIFASMFISLGVLYPMFLSASFNGLIMRGLLPLDIQAMFTWTTWFISILPWGIIVFIGSYLVIQILYRPENEKPLPRDYIKNQLTELGPMSKSEKITIAVLSISLLFWMTEQLHRISAAQIALFAMCILIVSKVLDRQDFQTRIPWNNIVLIGGIINLTSVLPFLKIDKWIAAVLNPYVAPLMSNIYLLIFVAAVCFYLIRFILISQAAALTIFVVLLIPFAVQAGINPWVPGIITLVSVNVWNVIYQNTIFLAAFYSALDMISFKQMVPLSVSYMVLSLVGLWASVPLWQVLDLVP